MTVEQLAELVHSTPDGIRAQRHRGNGPKGVRIGRRILFRPEDVAAWLEERAENRS